MNRRTVMEPDAPLGQTATAAAKPVVAERPRKRSHRRWVLNYQLLVGTVLLAAVGAPAAYVLHRHQVQRNAAALLSRAAEHESRAQDPSERDTSQEWLKAAAQLGLYLRLQPADISAQVRLAKALDIGNRDEDVRRKLPAMQAYALAIGELETRDPKAPPLEGIDLVELRHSHMILLMEIGYHSSALAQAEKLLAQVPDDAAALQIKSLCLYALWTQKSRSAKEAAAALEVANANDPTHAQVALNRARLLRREPGSKPEESIAKSDEVMDRLVAASPRQAEAYVTRHICRVEFDLSGADEDLNAAIAADTEGSNVEVQLSAAARAFKASDWETAAKHYEQVIRSASDRDNPVGQTALERIRAGGRDRRSDRRQGYLGLARVYRAQQDHKKELETLETYLELAEEDAKGKRGVEKDVEFQIEIADCHLRLANYPAATAALDALEAQLKTSFDRRQSQWRWSMKILQADIEFARKEYPRAARLYQQAVSMGQALSKSAESSLQMADLHARLGRTFQVLQQFDQAAFAYQQSVELNPRGAATRTALADSWAAAGNLDEAARNYRLAIQIQGVAPETFVALSDVLHRQQMALPESKRDWSEFEQTLIQAERSSRNRTAVLLLAAQYRVAQKDETRALALLREAEQGALRLPATASRMALVYEGMGLHEEADRIAAELEENVEHRLPAVRLRVDLLSRRDEYEQAVRQLVSLTLTGLTPEQRRAIQEQLVALHLVHGHKQEARAELNNLCKQDSKNLQYVQRQVELALETGLISEAETLTETLKKIEGDDGTCWRLCQARILALEASQSNDQGKIQRALEELQKLQGDRPGWAPVYLLKAHLAQLQAKQREKAGVHPAEDPMLRAIDNAAIDALIQAIRLGEKRIPVFHDLIRLLYRQNRFAEATIYVDRCRDGDSLPPELASLGILAYERQGNTSQAIATAREEVLREPSDASKLQMLRLLFLTNLPSNEAERAKRLAAAESEFNRVRELSPNDSVNWIWLLSVYTSMQKFDSARALLAELEKSDSLAKPEKLMVSGQGYHLLASQKQPQAAADLEQAKALFRRAAEEGRDVLVVQLQAAEFLAKYDELDLAKSCALRAYELNPRDQSARKLLAMVITAQGGPEDTVKQQVSELLDPKAGETAAVTDKRLKAHLTMYRGGRENRQQARELLEELVNEKASESVPLDRLLLAKLYEAQGPSGTASARKQLEFLIDGANPKPDHLAVYIDHLLRTGQTNERDVLRRLEQLNVSEPEETHARTLGLRARWLKKQDKPEAIQPLVERFVSNRRAKAKNAAEEASILLIAARLYASLDMNSPAEAAFRETIKLQPSTYQFLASWLAQQGRLQDALDLCLSAAMTDQSPAAATVLSGVLTVGKPTPQQRKMAEPVLTRALAAYPKDQRLLFSVGTMHLIMDETEDAIRLFREVLKVNNRHLAAMNNLSMALSCDPKGYSEARKWADQAISIAGKSRELLDSKGWVLLQQGNAAEAAALFEEALSIPPGEARFHFHLALAQHSQGKLEDAKASLRVAKELDLASELLTPREQSHLEKLETALR
jgi:tetratricopeptide (TPR) repeat protein